MKYCPKCGAPENNDAAAFCASCGSAFAVEQQAQYAQPQYNAVPGFWNAMSQYLLFVFAGVFALLGILVMTGTMWNMDTLYGSVSVGDMLDYIYEARGAIQAFDIIVGLLLIGSAALAVLARFRLVAFRKQAVLFMNLSFFIAAGASILYFFFQFIAWEAPDMGAFVDQLTSPLITMLLGFVWLGFGIYNMIFFKGRKYMLR